MNASELNARTQVDSTFQDFTIAEARLVETSNLPGAKLNVAFQNGTLCL